MSRYRANGLSILGANVDAKPHSASNVPALVERFVNSAEAPQQHKNEHRSSNQQYALYRSEVAKHRSTLELRAYFTAVDRKCFRKRAKEGPTPRKESGHRSTHT